MDKALQAPGVAPAQRSRLAVATALLALVALAACEVREQQAQPAKPAQTETSAAPVAAAAPPPPSLPMPAAAPPPPPASAPAISRDAARMEPSLAGRALSRVAPGYTVQQPPAMAETARFPEAEPNSVRAVREHPVSTFSVDVDTASYAVVRRFLRENRMPPRGAIRVEEMVNYFPYGYAGPEDRSAPFRVAATVLPTPWNKDTQLLHVAIKGYDVARAEAPGANIVLLVDVSGSMGPADRLPLLKQAFRLFASELKPDDRLAIVTYAGRAGVALEPTRAAERDTILAAIDALQAGGSTAGFDGIQRTYALAERGFDRNRVNRVILATDGDFNVGITNPKELEAFVADKRKTGIYLTVLGVGLSNLNDLTMQKLAQAGNGNAGYIDSLLEARKVLKEELASTLFPIADDVKIQVEFNPARVAEYRLIGYETRALRREDFNNDRVDAGEIGSGHAVTALYEITAVGSKGRLVDPLRYGQEAAPAADPGGEIAFLRLRYKRPGESDSRLIERPIGEGDRHAALDAAPADVRFAAAVAAFGQLLRGDDFMNGYGYGDVAKLAQGARGADAEGYRAELVQLVRQAETVRLAAGR